jgi:DNA processing protein
VEELLPWFQLKSVPGIGNLLFKRLVLRFGSPDAVLRAAAADLQAVEGISARLARAIASAGRRTEGAAGIEAALKGAHRLLTLADPEYPPLLREIPDPPPLLYVRGSLAGTERPVAVVGSRNATAYGIGMARRLAADLAALGFAVVSGLALGIDAAAHEGALAAAGRTVAVLGSGLEKIYPPQNRRLCERIAAGGAVVTELAPDAGPEPHHFPARNRIISGMSFGVVVVEAARSSGALITARLAAEQNREVFAVPGSVQSFKSTGPHALIKQGAKLVENAQDVVAELGHFLAGAAVSANAGVASTPPPGGPRLALTPAEAEVLRALDAYPRHIDELVRRLGSDAGQTAATLLQLELKGLVTQLPGKRFAAVGPGES